MLCLWFIRLSMVVFRIHGFWISAPAGLDEVVSGLRGLVQIYTNITQHCNGFRLNVAIVDLQPMAGLSIWICGCPSFLQPIACFEWVALQKALRNSPEPRLLFGCQVKPGWTDHRSGRFLGARNCCWVANFSDTQFTPPSLPSGNLT